MESSIADAIARYLRAMLELKGDLVITLGSGREDTTTFVRYQSFKATYLAQSQECDKLVTLQGEFPLNFAKTTRTVYVR